MATDYFMMELLHLPRRMTDWVPNGGLCIALPATIVVNDAEINVPRRVY